jgi:carboxylesterase
MTRTPDDDRHAVLPEARPWSADGGPHGALVVHGFTGNPSSMRGLAEAFAAAQFAVELPRLPGHGTHVDDMIETRWDDWTAEVARAYSVLAARVDRVVVAGLSMGGALTAWLALERPEIAGIVLINTPVGVPPEMSEGLRGLVDGGMETIDAIGGDVADPDVGESSYDKTPLAPLLSLAEAGAVLRSRLGEIRCPALIMNSPQDHVVPPGDSDILATELGGPVERVTLERSFHVATIDFDKDLVNERALEFARRVVA